MNMVRKIEICWLFLFKNGGFSHTTFDANLMSCTHGDLFSLDMMIYISKSIILTSDLKSAPDLSKTKYRINHQSVHHIGFIFFGYILLKPRYSKIIIS